MVLTDGGGAQQQLRCIYVYDGDVVLLNNRKLTGGVIRQSKKWLY